MKLIFTRHGESEANVLRVISNRDLLHALTERGRQQALALAKQLEGMGVTHIYCSPILRARQTAQIVADQLGVGFEPADALREFDCGIAEGCGDDQAWQLHNGVVHTWRGLGDHDARINDGESFSDIRARFVPFVESLCTRHGSKDGSILCISHGGVLSLMLPVVMENIPSQLHSEQPIGNCALIVAEIVEARLVCAEWCGTRLN